MLRIFGPIKSGICACGNYRVIGDEKEDTKFCEQCEIEFVDSRIRRFSQLPFKQDLERQAMEKQKQQLDQRMRLHYKAAIEQTEQVQIGVT